MEEVNLGSQAKTHTHAHTDVQTLTHEGTHPCTNVDVLLFLSRRYLGHEPDGLVLKPDLCR